MNGYNRKTGSPIVSTLERLTGCASIIPGTFEKADRGVDFTWGGYTDVDWDSQTTVEDADNRRIFVDEDGEEVPEDQIELRDDDQDQDEQADAQPAEEE